MTDTLDQIPVISTSDELLAMLRQSPTQRVVIAVADRIEENDGGLFVRHYYREVPGIASWTTVAKVSDHSEAEAFVCSACEDWEENNIDALVSASLLYADDEDAWVLPAHPASPRAYYADQLARFYAWQDELNTLAVRRKIERFPVPRGVNCWMQDFQDNLTPREALNNQYPTLTVRLCRSIEILFNNLHHHAIKTWQWLRRGGAALDDDIPF